MYQAPRRCDNCAAWFTPKYRRHTRKINGYRYLVVRYCSRACKVAHYCFEKKNKLQRSID